MEKSKQLIIPLSTCYILTPFCSAVIQAKLDNLDIDSKLSILTNQMAKVLIGFVVSLFGLATSIQLKGEENVDIFIQLGDNVELTAVADDWFGAFTLKNKLQKVICEVTFRQITHKPYHSVCERNITYDGDASKHTCQFQVPNIQDSGKMFSFFMGQFWNKKNKKSKNLWAIELSISNKKTDLKAFLVVLIS